MIPRPVQPGSTSRTVPRTNFLTTDSTVLTHDANKQEMNERKVHSWLY